MPIQLNNPEFTSEAEEAEWWFNNQEMLLDEFEKAEKNGTLGHGVLARKAAAETVQLAPQDIQLARKQAERQGLDVQAYLQLLLHRALQQEAKKQDVAA